jgi:hypothetical protein
LIKQRVQRTFVTFAIIFAVPVSLLGSGEKINEPFGFVAWRRP